MLSRRRTPGLRPDLVTTAPVSPSTWCAAPRVATPRRSSPSTRSPGRRSRWPSRAPSPSIRPGALTPPPRAAIALGAAPGTLAGWRRPVGDRTARGRASSSSAPPMRTTVRRCSSSWRPRSAGFRTTITLRFGWKHGGPFGSSPAWVAVDGDRIAGYRTFRRWEFQRGERVLRAVRRRHGHPPRLPGHLLPPDAASPRRAPRRGRRLRLQHAQRAEPAGVSQDGLAGGGTPTGAPAAEAAASLPKIAASRTPAEKWSLASTAGLAPAEAFADTDALAGLLATQPVDDRIRTRRTVEYFRWRYGFERLQYRIVLLGSSVADGFAVYRLRRRGGVGRSGGL